MPAAAATSWAATRSRLLAIERAQMARVAAGDRPELAEERDTDGSVRPPVPVAAFDAPTCSICLEELAKPGHAPDVATHADPATIGLTLPCRHRFHAACLDLVFGNLDNPRNTCPLCRAPVFPRPGDGGGGFVDGPVEREQQQQRWRPEGGRAGLGLDLNGLNVDLSSGWGGGDAAARAGAEAAVRPVDLGDPHVILRALHARYPEAVPWQALPGAPMIPGEGFGLSDVTAAAQPRGDTGAGSGSAAARGLSAALPPGPGGDPVPAAAVAGHATAADAAPPQPGGGFLAPTGSGSQAPGPSATAPAAFAPLGPAAEAPAIVTPPMPDGAAGVVGEFVGHVVGGAAEVTGRVLLELGGALLGGLCSGGGGGSW